MALEIFDSEGTSVFAYEGPSTLMPSGLFYEIVNTCGGEGVTEAPSDLKASVDGEDVVLQWKGIADPGYGYNIYRDGVFYTMVPDATSFTDAGAAIDLHKYFVTAFTKEGESDPTNTVDAVVDTPEMAPRDLDIEILEDGKVRITWNAPEQTENLAGYQIYRKATGEDYHRVKSCGANTTNYKESFNLPSQTL